MKRNETHRAMSVIFVSVTLSLLSGTAHAADYKIHYHPEEYVLGKFETHAVVLLGTRHKKDRILQFISDLIPNLRNAGITHIGFEIRSDQQDYLDLFMETGKGLDAVNLHPQIDCPAYRHLLKQIRVSGNLRPVALDLPKSRYGQKSRDEYMAQSIAKVFRKKPDAKMLVVAGNNHVLKKLDWQDHVPDKTGSMRSYLNDFMPGLSVFSIGQLIDENPAECDFTRRFGNTGGPVAMDCDERFKGWKIGLTSAIAIKPAEPYNLVDGVIVY